MYVRSSVTETGGRDSGNPDNVVSVAEYTQIEELADVVLVAGHYLDYGGAPA